MPSQFITIDETKSDPPRPVVIRISEIAAVDARLRAVYLKSGQKIQLEQHRSLELLRTALAATEKKS